jgi:hypothetical protein
MNLEKIGNSSLKNVFNADVPGDDEGISLEQIALLTDFPEDFIKKELLIDVNEISMKEFRVKVLEYLEKTIQLEG